MEAALLRALISVSSIRSKLVVLGDGVTGTFWASLESVLIRLIDLDLIEALILLEALGRLENLTTGALRVVIPLIMTAIGAEGRN